MEQNLKKCLCRIKYEPENCLAENTWHAIIARNKKIARLRFFGFAMLGLVSAISFVPVCEMMLRDFAKSGFYEYWSLAFSSISSISSYWKEFAFSLAESLPTVSVILSLGLIFIFFLSLRSAMKQITKGHLSLSFKV